MCFIDYVRAGRKKLPTCLRYHRQKILQLLITVGYESKQCPLLMRQINAMLRVSMDVPIQFWNWFYKKKKFEFEIFLTNVWIFDLCMMKLLPTLTFGYIEHNDRMQKIDELECYNFVMKLVAALLPDHEKRWHRFSSHRIHKSHEIELENVSVAKSR